MVSRRKSRAFSHLQMSSSPLPGILFKQLQHISIVVYRWRFGADLREPRGAIVRTLAEWRATTGFPGAQRPTRATGALSALIAPGEALLRQDTTTLSRHHRRRAAIRVQLL